MHCSSRWSIALVPLLGACGTNWGDLGSSCPNGPCQRCQCVPYVADGTWSHPMLLWYGDGPEPEHCPAHAGEEVRRGNAEIVVTHECPECRCDPPTGSCKLPTTITAYSAPLCPATGAEKTSFDAPDGWDGSCTLDNAIDKDKLCEGGTEKCVQSLSIGPLDIKEDGCAVAMDPVPARWEQAVPKWKKRALACITNDGPTCSDPLHYYCAPATPPGFSVCLWTEDNDTPNCPTDYPIRRVVHPDNPFGYRDSRSCSECKCEWPAGSYCMSQVALYSSSGCSGVPFWSNPVTSGGCVDVMPAGVALTSKEATEPVYMPGECKPIGGEKIGTVVPIKPSTFCCRE